MTNRFFERVFIPAVKVEQVKHGSRTAYVRLDGSLDGTESNDVLTEHEVR